MHQRNDPRSPRLSHSDREDSSMSAQFRRVEVLARLGLRLPTVTLKRLQSAGIFCQPAVSVEYQQHAHGYVLRAVESGGAIAELGAYCGVVGTDGNAVMWS